MRRAGARVSTMRAGWKIRRARVQQNFWAHQSGAVGDDRGRWESREPISQTAFQEWRSRCHSIAAAHAATPASASEMSAL
jgi:hypothetical protein